MTSDIVEQIDALAAEEKCPHCDRQWHDKPLTRAVALMFDRDRIEPDYFTGEDRSPVVCDGSSLVGPRRPPSAYANGGLVTGAPTWVSGLYNSTWEYIGNLLEWPKMEFPEPIFDTSAWTLGALQQLKQSTWNSYTYTLKVEPDAPWFIPESEPKCEPVADIEVEFGPQNWLPAQEPVHAPPELKVAVSSHLPEFAKHDFPVPESPGYDFSEFNTEPAYPTGKKKVKR